MCIMYCVMCFFGGVLVACNWVINDQLLKYKIHVQVGAPGTDYEGAYAPADLVRLVNIQKSSPCLFSMKCELILYLLCL